MRKGWLFNSCSVVLSKKKSTPLYLKMISSNVSSAVMPARALLCVYERRVAVYLLLSGFEVLQHAATRCNTLQHTATHCNTVELLFSSFVKKIPLNSRKTSSKVSSAVMPTLALLFLHEKGVAV